MDAKDNASFINSAANEMPVTCVKCGASNKSGNKFCTSCGAALSIGQDSQADTPAFESVQEEISVQTSASQSDSTQASASLFADFYEWMDSKLNPAPVPKSVPQPTSVVGTVPSPQSEPQLGLNKGEAQIPGSTSELKSEQVEAETLKSELTPEEETLPKAVQEKKTLKETFRYVEPNTVFASGLPEWSIEPPQVMVRRR